MTDQAQPPKPPPASSAVDPRLVTGLFGLVLFGVGLGLWYLPAGFIGPGAVLLWVSTRPGPRPPGPPAPSLRGE